MPQPSAPPCRLIRFDHLATPRLEAPLGPGFVAKQGSDGSSSGSGAALPLPQLRYSGVFVCGPRPVWLVANRGGFVVHPMEADVGQVDAFCAFHNLNCVHGYMAASLAGALNICTLPLQVGGPTSGCCWFDGVLTAAVLCKSCWIDVERQLAVGQITLCKTAMARVLALQLGSTCSGDASQVA